MLTAILTALLTPHPPLSTTAGSNHKGRSRASPCLLQAAGGQAPRLAGHAQNHVRLAADNAGQAQVRPAAPGLCPAEPHDGQPAVRTLPGVRRCPLPSPAFGLDPRSRRTRATLPLLYPLFSPADSPEEKRVKSHVGRVSAARLSAVRSVLSEEQRGRIGSQRARVHPLFRHTHLLTPWDAPCVQACWTLCCLASPSSSLATLAPVWKLQWQWDACRATPPLGLG